MKMPKEEMNARERRAAERAAQGVTAPSEKKSFLSVEALKAELIPVIEEFGCVLESIAAKGAGNNRTLEIVVDYREGTDFLPLDTVAEISQALSAKLDAIDDGDAPYMLEVSSPGATRTLEEERHWHRSVGRLFNIAPADGGEKYLARLVSVTDEGPELARKKNTKKGQKVSYHPAEILTWNSISSAKVEIEFNH